MALRNQVGEKQTVAETQVALAQLSIEEGHAADAEAAMRTCKEQFHREHQADDELAASIVLTNALLAQGKHDEARKELQAGEILAGNSQNRLERLQFALVSARVLLASGQSGSSRQHLNRILGEARHYGFMGVELEARLALAQSEKKSGQTAAAQSQLLALERAARAQGFGLIAHKAAANQGRELGT